VKKLSTGFSKAVPGCDGELWLPDNPRPPVVIMAHGFGAERSFGLPAFAERFVAAGIAVYLFDYRGFGASDGYPRQLVHPWRHLRDWRDALAHVRSLEQVDSDRIALWGSSYSGGHVTVTAAHDQRVAAVVAQVPFVSGISTLAAQSPVDMMRLSWAGLRDLLRLVTFRAPYRIGLVGRPGEVAVMTTPECYDGYMALVPEQSRWENKTPALSGLLLPLYNPGSYAAGVRCPMLIVAGRNDSLIPISAVRKMAKKVAYCRLEEFDCNHFEPYQGSWFDRNIELQSAFLQRHLRVSGDSGD
jgi:pimeloyl-ACP methyl ester carboxylesterase